MIEDIYYRSIVDKSLKLIRGSVIRTRNVDLWVAQDPH